MFNNTGTLYKYFNYSFNIFIYLVIFPHFLPTSHLNVRSVNALIEVSVVNLVYACSALWVIHNVLHCTNTQS